MEEPEVTQKNYSIILDEVGKQRILSLSKSKKLSKEKHFRNAETAITDTLDFAARMCFATVSTLPPSQMDTVVEPFIRQFRTQLQMTIKKTYGR